MKRFEYLDAYIGKHVIHICTTVTGYKDGKHTRSTERRDVILMKVARGWAMVRRPHCSPYACPAEELEVKL